MRPLAGVGQRRPLRLHAAAFVPRRAAVEVHLPRVVGDREAAPEERSLLGRRLRPEERVDGLAERRLAESVGTVDHIHARDEAGGPETVVVDAVVAANVEVLEDEGCFRHVQAAVCASC